MFNVIIISIIIMLTYISHEMIYPLIPIYITSVLGATPAIAGLVEGISKSLSSLAKFYSGYISDKKKNKKQFFMFSYVIALFGDIILIISTSWIGVFIYKITERFSKAVRSAPMDSIISESYQTQKRGIVFGINRFFNKLGSVIGILISYIILSNTTNIDYQNIFLIAIIPVVIAFILSQFIKKKDERGIVDLNLIDKNLQFFLIIVFISSIGNCAKTFLLLRAENIGFTALEVIFLYLTANLFSCIFAYPIGKLCDKIEKKYIVSLAYFIYAIVCLLFAITESRQLIYILFPLYGIYIALISIGVKTFISEAAPPNMKATIMGISDCLVGLGSLPAAIITGFLWQNINPGISFCFNSILGFISCILIMFIVKVPYRKN